MSDERTEERRAFEGEMREFQFSCIYAYGALLAAHPCSKCGSADRSDGRQFFTPRTYHRVHGLGAFRRRYDAAATEQCISEGGLVSLCAACWTKLQANGSWAAIVAARLESKKEKNNAGTE